MLGAPPQASSTHQTWCAVAWLGKLVGKVELRCDWQREKARKNPRQNYGAPSLVRAISFRLSYASPGSFLPLGQICRITLFDSVPGIGYSSTTRSSSGLSKPRWRA